ncbi:hypothetical protein FOCC_FOCC016552 [Frankliniella occidentalis]|nr:hypothetical protein FOCC_FOCC016552 [Frankliniella occidentalis]
MPTGQQYRFIAMVVHRGTSLDEGHYIAAAKCADRSFYLFNDHQVGN